MLREILTNILKTGNVDLIEYPDDFYDMIKEYIDEKLWGCEENMISAEFDESQLYFEHGKLKFFCRPNIGYSKTNRECDDCDGSGEVDGKTCETCNGTGFVDVDDNEEHGMSGKMWIYLNQNTLEPVEYNIDWKNSW